jgi:hypothetical protein
MNEEASSTQNDKDVTQPDSYLVPLISPSDRGIPRYHPAQKATGSCQTDAEGDQTYVIENLWNSHHGPWSFNVRIIGTQTSDSTIGQTAVTMRPFAPLRVLSLGKSAATQPHSFALTWFQMEAVPAAYQAS